MKKLNENFIEENQVLEQREKIEEVNSLTKILENVFDYHSDKIIMNLFVETSLVFFSRRRIK
jgi:hypothetical protein